MLFSIVINRKRDMGLSAVTDGPSGLPIPTFSHLAVLQGETLGIAVHAGNPGFVIAAQEGAEFPAGQGRMLGEELIAIRFGQLEGTSFATELFVREAFDEAFATT